MTEKEKMLAGMIYDANNDPQLIAERLDCGTLDSLKSYRQVVTLEDGIVDGGFGQKVAAYLGDSDVRVNVLGLRKEFLDRYKAYDVLRANSLTAPQIADLVKF